MKVKIEQLGREDFRAMLDEQHVAFGMSREEALGNLVSDYADLFDIEVEDIEE